MFVHGNSFDEALTRWGQVLIDFNGGNKVIDWERDDFASDYLSEAEK